MYGGTNGSLRTCNHLQAGCGGDLGDLQQRGGLQEECQEQHKGEEHVCMDVKRGRIKSGGRGKEKEEEKRGEKA